MPNRVALKSNRVMMVTDPLGDILPDHEDNLGIYLDDTRFVSRFHLKFGNKSPVLLSYSAENGAVATIRLVNAALRQHEGKEMIPRQSISIRRTRFISDGLHERIQIENCAPGPTSVAGPDYYRHLSLPESQREPVAERSGGPHDADSW